MSVRKAVIFYVYVSNCVRTPRFDCDFSAAPPVDDDKTIVNGLDGFSISVRIAFSGSIGVGKRERSLAVSSDACRRSLQRPPSRQHHRRPRR